MKRLTRSSWIEVPGHEFCCCEVSALDRERLIGGTQQVRELLGYLFRRREVVSENSYQYLSLRRGKGGRSLDLLVLREPESPAT